MASCQRTETNEQLKAAICRLDANHCLLQNQSGDNDDGSAEEAGPQISPAFFLAGAAPAPGCWSHRKMLQKPVYKDYGPLNHHNKQRHPINGDCHKANAVKRANKRRPLPSVRAACGAVIKNNLSFLFFPIRKFSKGRSPGSALLIV